ncbi:thermonuclease family protein [Paenibacillus sp. P96]|uniref:Thermonuclease family protein n=1 Tax=Paenibacillus zeirhizosphaerae TaxID=2987519 RepID=A0ABT9FVW3_9BACL|nr:thermonuclease family protein [Paenibacillus sp. P96]MDP4098878.1 thermonuclease family protein [Paenibacillus sp. P96]
MNTKNTMPRLISSIIGLLALLLIAGCGTTSRIQVNSTTPATIEETSQAEYPRVKVKLDKAVDGDTLRVIYDGKQESVRMLLIDTPETSHPRLGVQPFGPEAKAYTKQLLEQAHSIELEFDVGQQRDKYGRLLAYVYADDVMVQETLLKEGLARVAYIYPPNVRYVDPFEELQKASMQKGIGIWSVENYAREDGFHPATAENSSESSAGNKTSADTAAKSGTEEAPPSAACAIKGNISSKGDKIYHTPESPSYERTQPEQWFCTVAEAEKEGFRAPR